jgi:hypothetical protein
MKEITPLSTEARKQNTRNSSPVVRILIQRCDADDVRILQRCDADDVRILQRCDADDVRITMA